MLPLTEEELLTAFSGASEDVVLPRHLDETPWEHLDYLGWVHPSGHLGYLVLVSPDDGRICGTVMRRSRFKPKRYSLEMCSLCHHVHQPNGTALFTIENDDGRRRHSLGNVVCKNLDCSLRLRNLIDPESFLRETLYPEAKIWRMQMTLHKWLRNASRL